MNLDSSAVSDELATPDFFENLFLGKYRTLLNVFNMLVSKQNLLITSLGLKSKLIEQEFSEAKNTANISNADDFSKAYDEVGAEKCNVLKLHLKDRTFSLTLSGDGK